MPYRVVQPWGGDRAREADEVFACETITEAFAKVDRYLAHFTANGQPPNYLELLVVD